MTTIYLNLDDYNFFLNPKKIKITDKIKYKNKFKYLLDLKIKKVMLSSKIRESKNLIP